MFNKITDWKNRIAELRNSADSMSIHPFERAVFPNRVSSPLLAGPGKKLPGGLLGPGVTVKQETEPTPPPSKPPASNTAASKSASKSSGITYTPVTAAPTLAAVPQISRPSVDRSVVAAVTSAAPGATYRVEKLPPETSGWF